ncbi:family 16 glycosylhydrolase [Bacteroides sp. BFG-551]|nr:family 16 glycosylhydrolase [Bacteroides sp. BFG-551]
MKRTRFMAQLTLPRHLLIRKKKQMFHPGTIMVDDVETSFHIYGMNWTDEKVEFYVDDPSNVYLTFTPSQKDNPRFGLSTMSCT